VPADTGAQPPAARAGSIASGPSAVAAPAQRRNIVPLVAGFLIILLLAGVSTWLAGETRAENRAVSNALQVINAVHLVNQAVTETNSTQRGWLLTRSPVFRDRFNTAYGEIWPAHAALVEATKANPAQAARVASLRSAIAERVAEVDRVNLLLLAGDLSGAINRVLVARGQTDQIRAQLEEIREAEERELDRRQRQAEIKGAWLLAISLIGLGVIVLLASNAIRALREDAEQLARTNAEVIALNRDLEARVATRTADLAEANEEIQRFAYIVSHDLRAPLVNIMGFTAEIGESADAARRAVERTDAAMPGLIEDTDRQLILEELPESLAYIKTSTGRMDTLIRSILSLSREGRRELTPEPVDLGVLVTELVDTLRQQAETADAGIEIDPLPVIATDRIAIGQILGNLLDNAIKYLRTGIPGRIRVSCEDLGAFVRIHVIDNGRGIAPEDRDRVFDLFRRAGPQDRPGDGLGLAHVRALARRMGGSIQLESTPGEGSRFTLTLPRNMAAQVPRAGVLA
jgi:signal transduction histidine kinase